MRDPVKSIRGKRSSRKKGSSRCVNQPTISAGSTVRRAFSSSNCSKSIRISDTISPSHLVLTIFKRRKTHHEYVSRHERETISRSNLLSHPLLGKLSLQNQLGEGYRSHLAVNPSEDRAAYYTSSLIENSIYDSGAKVPGFVVDETNGTIIFAHSHVGNGNDALYQLRQVRPGTYDRQSHIFEAMPNTFSDMGISMQHQKLLCVSGGPHGTRAAMLDVPRDSDDSHTGLVNHVWNYSEETAWQMTVSPANGESFAIATSRGLRLISLLPDRISCAMSSYLKTPGGFEYTAVAFGRDERTVMAGRRSGVVVFLDRRTDDGVKRLFHGDAVSAMRTVDENRVVVRGLQKVRSLPMTNEFNMHRRRHRMNWMLRDGELMNLTDEPLRPSIHKGPV